MATAMNVPEPRANTDAVSLVRCPNGHYHEPGPCPFCSAAEDLKASAGASAAADLKASAEERLADPVEPRRRGSALFLFNVIAGTAALILVGIAWTLIFRTSDRPPGPAAPQPPKATAAAPATPAQPPAAAQSTAQALADAPKPTPIPPPEPSAPPGAAQTQTAQPQTAPAEPALADNAPLPVPRPQVPDPVTADAGGAPLQVAPQPQGLMPAPPQQQAQAAPPPQNGPYPWNGGRPPASIPMQPPRSNLPPAQRMGVPTSVIQQVRWLDGRTLAILVHALDTQPNETPVIEDRPSGDVVRARLRSGPPPCRYMEIYPSQRSDAFLFVRFCPDNLGRWMGQDMSGYR
ncbi:hypothetical protein [Azorhizobium caulinodans]|nr:hypothetical protein [Azorhizobium caulinodans]